MPQTPSLGRSDDITSLTLCPAPVDYDGKQYPAKTLVATAQVLGGGRECGLKVKSVD